MDVNFKKAKKNPGQRKTPVQGTGVRGVMRQLEAA